jgi:Zn-dependent protease with chaperone function
MAARRKKADPGPTEIRYPGLSPLAYEHPADRAAGTALRSIPGLERVVKQLIELGYERALRQAYLSASLLTGPDQLPDLSARWDEVGRRLDLPQPAKLYVTQDPTIQAMAIGAQQPYVVMSSRAVEVLDADESMVVLAHEAGHVLSGHAAMRTALQILLQLGSMSGLVPLAGIPLTAIRVALLEWYRASELSCDRAAALATRDPDAVVRTLMVLGAGLPSSQLSVSGFRAQMAAYADWDDGPDRLRRFLLQMRQTHSFPVRRAVELTRWVESGDYERIVAGDYVRRDAEPSVRDTTGDAVDHYSDRFREIFTEAGGSISKMGKRFGTWLRTDVDDPSASTGDRADGSDGSDGGTPGGPVG